ncbi:ClpP/crotonase-like domain-containing protein [Blyttiomyces helicus]|uniref:ClpP/crotonase-like domain-containing protein n=1 Tax=Blyttiomyces helicus TaxID=388810 RepID=A0A4P9WA88_9FUNG|nr:ClpP/crotonase-like domain-containing protein [Blyttiomyces helicus]|eukprot:RKO89344.1 ClpP/crotonase-like domain-containing protein [Blyttiomyces helicus]
MASSATFDQTAKNTSQLEHIEMRTHGSVGIITFNRPDVMNALGSPVIAELNFALDAYENDPQIGALVITGRKAFAGTGGYLRFLGRWEVIWVFFFGGGGWKDWEWCWKFQPGTDPPGSTPAGANIKEMQPKTAIGNYMNNFLSDWTNVSNVRKPVIAAVNGVAFGGGCELAMMCDIVYAAENTLFGLPEIKLGTMPGAGGTQRLSRAIGKAKAMELVLTGRPMTAFEAEQAGLVARVFPPNELLEQALKTAALIASYSRPALMMAKEAVKKADEVSLSEGLTFERRLFWSTFGTKNQKEGMSAFLERRKPEFKNDEY